MVDSIIQTILRASIDPIEDDYFNGQYKICSLLEAEKRTYNDGMPIVFFQPHIRYMSFICTPRPISDGLFLISLIYYPNFHTGEYRCQTHNGYLLPGIHYEYGTHEVGGKELPLTSSYMFASKMLMKGWSPIDSEEELVALFIHGQDGVEKTRFKVASKIAQEKSKLQKSMVKRKSKTEW